MSEKNIRVLALDLDGTLTNDEKKVTPRTRAALDAAVAKGVTIVLASGRPTAGIMPLAKDLGLDKKGGCILAYNGGAIIDCKTGETLYQKRLDPDMVPKLCAFAAEQDIAILTYNKEGVVTERPEDEWAAREGFTCHLPMIQVEDLAAYVDYPICKMLIITTDRLPNTNCLNRTLVNPPRTFIIECPHLSKVGRQHFERAFT